MRFCHGKNAGSVFRILTVYKKLRDSSEHCVFQRIASAVRFFILQNLGGRKMQNKRDEKRINELFEALIMAECELLETLDENQNEIFNNLVDIGMELRECTGSAA